MTHKSVGFRIAHDCIKAPVDLILCLIHILCRIRTALDFIIHNRKLQIRSTQPAVWIQSANLGQKSEGSAFLTGKKNPLCARGPSLYSHMADFLQRFLRLKNPFHKAEKNFAKPIQKNGIVRNVCHKSVTWEYTEMFLELEIKQTT